jgi:hypothetical protein
VKAFIDYLVLPDGGFSSGHYWGILGGHPGDCQIKLKLLFATVIFNLSYYKLILFFLPLFI